MPEKPTVLVVNCRSIMNKVDELASLIMTLNPQIVMGTESWLDDTVSDTGFSAGIYGIS